MKLRLFLSFVLACAGLVFSSLVQAVSAPAVGSTANWAFQTAESDLGSLLLKRGYSAAATAGTAAMEGDLLISGAMVATRVNPWVAAVSTGLLIYGIVAETHSPLNPKIEVHPSPTVCLDKFNDAYCTKDGGSGGGLNSFFYVPGLERQIFGTADEACQHVTKPGPTYIYVGAVQQGSGDQWSCQFINPQDTASGQHGGASVLRYTCPLDQVWDLAQDKCVPSVGAEGPAKPKPDGAPGVKPAPPGFVPDGTDPDGELGGPEDGAGRPKPGGLGLPNVLTRSGTDSSGGQHKQSITANPDGGVTVETSDDYTNASGQRQTVKQSMTTDASGKVTGSTLSDTDTGSSPDGSGSTTNNVTVNVDTCGLPGKPECAVKVDEVGTPDASAAAASMSPAKTSLDKTKDDALAQVSDAKDPSNKSTQWTFSFQFPSSCTPLHLDGYELTIDMCKYQSVIHDLMAMVWVSATLFGCIAMVRSTMSGGA